MVKRGSITDVCPRSSSFLAVFLACFAGRVIKKCTVSCALHRIETGRRAGQVKNPGQRTSCGIEIAVVCCAVPDTPDSDQVAREVVRIGERTGVRVFRGSRVWEFDDGEWKKPNLWDEKDAKLATGEAGE